MDNITIRDPKSGSFAKISSEQGFNAYEFQAMLDGVAVDVIDSAPDFGETGGRPSGNGTPLLFPFPNRIAGGKHEWDDKQYTIPTGNPGAHAIHGFAYTVAWKVTKQTESSVTATFRLSEQNAEKLAAWPTDCQIEVTYTVKDATLRLDITVSNPSDKPMPWGFGTHTYFKVPLSKESSPESCLIVVPAAKEWPLENYIPTGEVRPVSPHADLQGGQHFTTLKLDDVLTGVKYDNEVLTCSIQDEQAKIEVVQRCDKSFREVTVYTPPNRNAFCFEPYTCATDAINLERRGIDAGWQTLEPGKEAKLWIEIIARKLK